MKQDIISYSDGELTINDIYISIGTVNFALKDKNPVDNVYFFKKNNLNGKQDQFYELTIDRILLD